MSRRICEELKVLLFVHSDLVEALCGASAKASGYWAICVIVS